MKTQNESVEMSDGIYDTFIPLRGIYNAYMRGEPKRVIPFYSAYCGLTSYIYSDSEKDESEKEEFRRKVKAYEEAVARLKEKISLLDTEYKSLEKLIEKNKEIQKFWDAKVKKTNNDLIRLRKYIILINEICNSLDLFSFNYENFHDVCEKDELVLLKYLGDLLDFHE